MRQQILGESEMVDTSCAFTPRLGPSGEPCAAAIGRRTLPNPMAIAGDISKSRLYLVEAASPRPVAGASARLAVLELPIDARTWV
jgi:hypothetical protein